MRDLLFKNLTSDDKRKRIITSSETMDKEGKRTVIHRHSICLIREVENESSGGLPVEIQVLKERNNKQQREKFFCRIKGSMYVATETGKFIIFFAHSLRINLYSIPQDLSKINE